MSQFEDLAAKVASALEAVRLEVLRRLVSAGLPPSIERSAPIAVDNEERTGFQMHQETRRVSSLLDPRIALAIRDVDDDGPMMFTFRRQLGPLAHHVDRVSSLGAAGGAFMPDLSGAEAVLIRHLARLAVSYLDSLESIDRPDIAQLGRYVSELMSAVRTGTALRVEQVALAGLLVPEPVTIGGVTLRELSPAERGRIAEMTLPDTTDHLVDAIPVNPLNWFHPTSLLEVCEPVPIDTTLASTDAISTFMLALFLAEFPVRSAGSAAVFMRPRWLGVGTLHTPIPVGQRDTPKLMNEANLRAVADLAQRVSRARSSNQRNALAIERALLGFGRERRDEGFLDFCIALEAMLLAGFTDELRYRFALYGALFLRDEFDPSVTFQRLKSVYDVRSKVVHGTPTTKQADLERRQLAERDAIELARATLRRSLVHGWPSADALDRRALSNAVDRGDE